MKKYLSLTVSTLIITSILGFSGCEAGLTQGSSSSSNSDSDFSFSDMYNKISALEAKNAALEAEFASLKQDYSTLLVSADIINNVQTTTTALQADVTALNNTFQGVSRSSNDIIFSGVNVQIVSGSGSTTGTVNGLGNLVIGYNELRGSGDDRTGSHNIVMGYQSNFSSYSGIVTGNMNSISGWYACAIGGYSNTVNGNYAGTIGGNANTASADFATVTGGQVNTASGSGSSISGGYDNIASGSSSTVSGGHYNRSTFAETSVSGGYNNEASGRTCTVSGGHSKTLTGDYYWQGGSLIQIN
ncbi:MAG: hypothetical protein GY754_11485 [bacterium]|nr:hypothetical protein [bacterium]